MQQTQQNYKIFWVGALALFLTLITDGTLQAARPSGHSLLGGGKSGPCDPKLDQPNYVGQVDVSGNPIVPADVPAEKSPVPGGVLVPLNKEGRGARGPVIALDGKALDPLLNPAPNCAARPR